MDSFQLVDREISIVTGILLLIGQLDVVIINVSKLGRISFNVTGPIFQKAPQPRPVPPPNFALVQRELNIIFGILLILGELEITGLSVGVSGNILLSVRGPLFEFRQPSKSPFNFALVQKELNITIALLLLAGQISVTSVFIAKGGEVSLSVTGPIFSRTKRPLPQSPFFNFNLTLQEINLVLAILLLVGKADVDIISIQRGGDISFRVFSPIFTRTRVVT